MSEFKYGTPVFFDTVKNDLILEDRPAEDQDVRSAMGERAIRNKNGGGGDEGFQNRAITRVKGMKEEFGNGISTQILIYNASGYKMTLQGSGSYSGKWSDYSAPGSLEVGEWGVSFHQKKAGAAVGSEGYMLFDFVGWGGRLAIQWSTPYWGTNTCKLQMKASAGELTAGTLSDDIPVVPETGSTRTGNIMARYSISDSSSSLFTVIITNE